MQTVTFDLPTLLKNLRTRSFLIPQFQRTFTWRESQVKLLVDSIARNYPVGSLLVLPRNPDLPLQSRTIEAVIRDSADAGAVPEPEPALPMETSPEGFYVLDGQQRLTSMARAFLNAHPRKIYYFDLRRMHEHFREEDTAWIVTRQRGKNDPDRKEKNRLLRSDIALDQQKADVYVSEYFEDSGEIPGLAEDRKLAREAAARIKGIFETIRKYQVPVVVLDRDAPVESVCRIFETINSTGTKLTTFDLAVARFYPSPDLRRLWEESCEKHSVLKEFEADGERVLQVLALWYSRVRNGAAEPSRGALLALRPEFIVEGWQRAAEVLAAAYNWARFTGATPETLPSHGLLVAIGGLFVLHPEVPTDPSQNFQSVVRRWYFSNGLQQGARQAANYKLGQDFTALLRYAEEGTIPDCPDVFLTVRRLRELNKSFDSRFKTLQCLMAATVREDLLSGQQLAGSTIEYHHIFPREMAQSHSLPIELLDSVANRLPVTHETNSRLSNTPPGRYFADLQRKAREQGTLANVAGRLSQCLLPGDIRSDLFIEQYSPQNYSDFLDKRANLILERVLEEVGDSLRLEDGVEPEED